MTLPLLNDLARIRRDRRTHRIASHDPAGRNADWWILQPGQSTVLADIQGPGQITHFWMAHATAFREVLLRITWDDAPAPSVLCPLGDFFGLGHGLIGSYQCALFNVSAGPYDKPVSTYDPVTRKLVNQGAALNCYLPMPFRKRAVIELVNQSDIPIQKWFYIDYERFIGAMPAGLGYLHAEFRRACPFGGWGPGLAINTAEVDAPCKEKWAYENNYVILETKGTGQYLGCNLSVANICGGWWGEGDDMIWVDGYHWPPDLHGTGSEDYLGHAWGMQPNAFLRNGTSLHEGHTGGYLTSYVHHLENPVYFEREIKVTLEHGHANHLGNDMASVAYWYATEPCAVAPVPPVEARLPVFKNADGAWDLTTIKRCPGPKVTLTEEQLDATPAAADSLRENNIPPVPLTALAPNTTLAQLPQVLVNLAPMHLMDGEIVLGRLRMAVAQDKLAVHVEVFDQAPKRVEPAFWDGCAIEFYGAPDRHGAGSQQVVCLPAVSGHPTEWRQYRTGVRHADPTDVIGEVRARPQAGYELVALIPLKHLGLSDARINRFEMALCLAAMPGKGTPRRRGLRTSASSCWHNVARGVQLLMPE